MTYAALIGENVICNLAAHETSAATVKTALTKIVSRCISLSSCLLFLGLEPIVVTCVMFDLLTPNLALG